VHGSMPTWKDLFIIQLVVLPFKIAKWVWRIFVPLPDWGTEERIELECKRAGITREEYDKRIQMYTERQEKLRGSSKYKRSRRMMKKILYEQGALKATSSVRAH